LDVWELWVLSGRGLCDELITRPEETYRLRYVVVSDLEISWMRRPCPRGGGGVSHLKQTKWVTLPLTKSLSQELILPLITSVAHSFAYTLSINSYPVNVEYRVSS
jgi:hypothetical protein